QQLVIASAGAKFTQTDLEMVTAQSDRQREQLERELTGAQTRRSTALQALEAAREELRPLPTRPDAAPAAATKGIEVVSARTAQLEAADTAIRVLRQLLEAGNMERAMWEMRFAS